MKKLLLSIVVTLFAAGSTFAQGGDFFWSTQGLNEGAMNGDADVKLFVGDTASLFLYYTTNGPAMSELDTGAFLDVGQTLAGIGHYDDCVRARLRTRVVVHRLQKAQHQQPQRNRFRRTE